MTDKITSLKACPNLSSQTLTSCHARYRMCLSLTEPPAHGGSTKPSHSHLFVQSPVPHSEGAFCPQWGQKVIMFLQCQLYSRWTLLEYSLGKIHGQLFSSTGACGDAIKTQHCRTYKAHLQGQPDATCLTLLTLTCTVLKGQRQSSPPCSGPFPSGFQMPQKIQIPPPPLGKPLAPWCPLVYCPLFCSLNSQSLFLPW